MAANSTSAPTRAPVLVVGAGPTGLMLSHWLVKYGVPHRIVDKNSGAGQTSRAIVMHARTLEFYRMLVLAEEVIALGTRVEGLTVLHSGQEQANIRVRAAGVGMSEYPFVLSVTQDEHEELLERMLIKRGQHIERGLEVVGVSAPGVGSDGDVTVTLRAVDSGKEETMTASYVIGCDGAHSGVRHATGITMEGGTYARSFFVADVFYSGDMQTQGRLNLCMSRNEFLVLMPLPHKTNRARIIGFVPEDKEDPATKISFEDCRPAVFKCAPNISIDDVRWFARYKVHHRTAAHFHHGPRVFLCGDAAHLHSPLGGQGMNTGLGDATNLAWKLATAYHQTASSPSDKSNAADLLATYEAERRPFALQLVQSTDTVFQLIIKQNLVGWLLRNVFMPYIVPFAASFLNIAPIMFKTISQTGIEYGKSPMSRSADATLAGHRLPWVERAGGAAGEVDNHAVLDASGWQAHVWGEVSEELEQALCRRKIEVKKFPWKAEAKKKGFVEDAVYLVRPDGYIGLVLGQGKGKEAEKTLLLEEYAEKWGAGQLTTICFPSLSKS